MRKEIYETPEIIMDKFETEDIMETSVVEPAGHTLTKVGGENITDPIAFV